MRERTALHRARRALTRAARSGQVQIDVAYRRQVAATITTGGRGAEHVTSVQHAPITQINGERVGSADESGDRQAT